MKLCPTCQRTYPDDVLFCPVDGARLQDAPAPSAPAAPMSQDPMIGSRLFGDYQVRKKLGEGGMGAVYLAEHMTIQQRLAIKVLHAQDAQQTELVQRFNREAQTISQLTNPNIIRVFVFGRTPDGMLFLAMEFVDGQPLRSLLERRGTLPVPMAIDIMRQSLHALAEAHELGIVHRDLKPDNIMITKFRNVENFVKILDFGIAKVKDPGQNQAKLTQAGVVYGTPEYLSPEQAMAKELDGRSDLYSMGIILYELMTGSVPFRGGTAVTILTAHVYDEPEPPSRRAPHLKIHPRMERIIMKALQKDPNLRYQTAMAFLEDLEDLEADLSGGASTKTTVLDASKVAALINVSRARQDQPPAPAAAPTVPAMAPPAGMAPPPGVATIPVQATQAAQIAGGQDNRLLWAVIIGLGLILAMMLLAIIYLAINRGGGTAALLPRVPLPRLPA
jgi:serine/threonine-protein kinase